MTPLELNQQLTRIVCEETGVTGCWQQSDRPLLPHEVESIEERVGRLLLYAMSQAVSDRQATYRARAAVRT